MNPHHPNHYAPRHNYYPTTQQQYHQPSMENHPGRHNIAPRHSGGGIPFQNLTNIVPNPNHRLHGSFNGAGFPAGPPLASPYANGGMHVTKYPTDVGVGFGYAPLPTPAKTPILSTPLPWNPSYIPCVPDVIKNKGKNKWPTPQAAPPQIVIPEPEDENVLESGFKIFAGIFAPYDDWVRMRTWTASYPELSKKFERYLRYTLYSKETLKAKPRQRCPTDEEIRPLLSGWFLELRTERLKRKTLKHLGAKLRSYVLTPLELALNDFVLPSYLRDITWDEERSTKYSGAVPYNGNWKTWMETKASSKPLAIPSEVYAIDCEMVLCGDEHVLAQICVVDFYTERVVYEKHVLPPIGRIVTDYLTDISGVTLENLQSATTTITDIRHAMSKLLADSNSILIGHGIHSDLQALKICHPTIIDTSLIFDPPTGVRPGKQDVWYRPKLRELVAAHLGWKDFQQGSHSPADDAKACIALVKLKCERGEAFGGVGYRAFRNAFVQEEARIRWLKYTGGQAKLAQGSAHMPLPVRRRSHAIEIKAPPTTSPSSRGQGKERGRRRAGSDSDATVRQV